MYNPGADYQAQLQSSLAPKSGGGGGFSLFGWHPSLPNLGGVTAIKQLASGFIGLPEMAATTVGDIAEPGRWHDLNPFEGGSTAQKFFGGVGQGVENLATTAASAVGVPGTRYNLGDEVLAPLLEKFNKIGPQMTDKQGNALKFTPSSWSQRPGGPITGLVQDASTMAMVAQPVAGSLAASAATAAEDVAKVSQMVAEGTATADDLATASARAGELAQKANIAKAFAHPYQTAGRTVSGLAQAAHEAAYPAQVAGEAGELAQTPAEALAASDEAASAAHTTPPKPEKGGLDTNALYQALRDAQGTETAAAGAAARPGEATSTVFRGESAGNVANAGEAGDARLWATTSEAHAREMYAGEGGKVFSQEVPNSVLDEAKAGGGESYGNLVNDKGEMAPQYRLSPEYRDTWHETQPQDWARPTNEDVVPKTQGKTTPPVNAVRPEAAQGETEQAFQQAEQTAREGVHTPHVAQQVAERLSLPAPPWAQRIVGALPDSANRVLAQLQKPISKFQFNSVQNDMRRYVEISQRVASKSETVQAAVKAGEDLLAAVPGLDRLDVTRMIGEEVTMELNGRAFVDSFVKDGGDPAMVDAMHRMARNGMSGIPENVREKIAPEQLAAIQQSIDHAVTAWQETSAARFQTLLASTKGAQGLEKALLGDTSPTMTPTQIKAYRRAVRDLRREQVLRSRIPEARAGEEAKAARQSLLSEKASAESDRLRAQVGVLQSTLPTLHDSVPLALRAENIDGAINAIKEGLVNGGVTFDVGRNITNLPPEGVVVGIAKQFDVPLEQFMVQGDDILRKAMQSPIDPDGKPYGPGVWAGPDARLGVTTHVGPDGRQYVTGDISMATWGGQALARWQATVLGEAYRQSSLFDIANGSSIELSGMPDVQNLMSNYLGDALDPKSDFARIGRQIEDTNNKIPGMTADDTASALRMWATWDHALAESNPEAFKHGDFFKMAQVGFGKSVPTTPSFLAQTVLGLSTHEGVEKALSTLTAKQVSDALSWYYDSHDYIESMWRGKTITLLDGSQRDAADVFYDLLAVTSVMASPKQNLGRALMALANTEDFLKTRKDAFASTEALLKRLDAMKPGTGELKGTKLSTKFLTREVRRLTHQTSMTNQPKYNVFDIMRGKLRLDEATTEDIAQLPEWWTGEPKSISDQNLPHENIIAAAERNGASPESTSAYRQWLAHSNELEGVKGTLTGRAHKPILRSQLESDSEAAEPGRFVSPAEFERQATEGRRLLDQADANSSAPTGLDDNWDSLVHEMYTASRDKWGGGTIDTHTGKGVAEKADAYAVTARNAGKKSVILDATAGEKVFAAKMQQARTRFAAELAREGAHLGIFHTDTGKIEIDPAMVPKTPEAADAIGAASHSEGGAFHFKSGNGRWAPAVEDYYASEASLHRELARSKGEGAALLKSNPELRRAHDDALTEYQGSHALAKLRSFRSNLSDPHNSLAVTLDSVMAKMYGFSNQDWAGGGTYGMHADEIRQAAKMLSERFGHEVKPHEVQALLWVYTKMEVGRQDFGRLLAHHDLAQGELDTMEKMLQAGKQINPKGFDPLGDYFAEELGYGREALDQRRQRKYLTDQAKKIRLTPEQQAELDHLKTLDLRNGIRESDHLTAQPREDVGTIPEEPSAYSVETRKSIPYDAKELEFKERRYAKYVAPWRDDKGKMHEGVRTEIQQALANGDVDEARRLLTSYVVKQRRGIMGDVGGSFRVVGEETRNTPKESAFIAEQRLQNAKFMPTPGKLDDYSKRGNISELHQQFGNVLRGATVIPADQTSRLSIRLYHDAALDTLAHEGGHLLRQLLPQSELQQVLAHYPHLIDETLSPERIAAEERFVSDLMFYMRSHARVGDTGPLSDVFRRIAATMEEQHAAVLDSQVGRGLTPDISAFWDRLFHPGIERPDKLVDPINARRQTSLMGTETKQFRWESDAQFARRARQYGELRAQIEATQYKADLARRAAAKADSASRRMWAALTNEPLKIEKVANNLHTHAFNVLDKLGRELEDPTTAQVPREFKEMWTGFQQLREQAKIDPRIAEALDEIPSTFSAVLREAAKAGVDPQYLPDMTWEQAQRWVFGHIQIGHGNMGSEVTSSMRRENRGVLSKNQLNQATIEGLGAASVSATHELYSNMLVKFIEDNWARDFTPGSRVPDGWRPWDSARDFVLTGTDRRGNYVAANATKIIPVEVDRAITNMSKRYDHWIFHTLSKVTNPWITYNMTLSPKWYLHVAVSDVVRAVAEGVSLKDWQTVIGQWRTGTLPEEVYGHSIANLMADGTHTLLGRTINEARQNEGMKAALNEVKGRVRNIHDVVDKLSRAAVFEHTLRTGGSREMAVTRSYEAMVDYGALSPFERSAVRAVIPFYPFYKGMVKLLARFPADHPVATGLLLILGQMHEEYLKDKLGGALPDAYRGYANIGGFHNFTILDPFLNPTHLVDVHNVSTTLNPFIDIMLRDAYNAAEPGAGQPGMSATGQKVTQVNVAQALGQTVVQAPIARAVGQVATGGDVYRKNPGVLGGIEQYLGVPTTPDTAKIQASVEKTLGTLPKRGQPGYRAPRRAKRGRVHSTRAVRHSFLHFRVPRVRKPPRPR